VGFTIGSRGKVTGKNCEKRRRRRRNNNNNNSNIIAHLWGILLKIRYLADAVSFLMI
jgi:hypothetical protein